jgi:tetratricopeptide (TPR) repeat protein
VVVVLGMVLLFMRAAFNPGSSGAPEESVPEFAAQPGECDLSTDHLLAGNSALESGDYEAALAEFTCEIQSDMTNYEARLGRIFAHLLLGQYALQNLDWAVIKHENSRLWNEAIDRYSAALEANRDDLLLLVKRSYVTWATLGQFDEAIADFDRILELDPDNIYALLFRGMSYQWSGDSDSAAADFERVIALAPDNPYVYAQIGQTYGVTGRMEPARENIEHAIQLDPEVATFYLWRCFNFIQLDDCTHAVELEPEEPLYYYWRGVFYREYTAGHLEEALADFTHAIELEPEWASFYFERALSLARIGDAASIPADMLQVIEHLQTVSIDQDVVIGENVTLPLTTGTVYRIPILAQTGQKLTVRGAGQPSASSNPIYVILNAENTPLASNLVGEDVGGIYAIRNYEIPADGMYTLLVSLSLNPTEGDHTFVVELDG